MSPSPNSSLVQRTIDLNYANKKRSESLKWIALNAVLLLVFVYDLSCKCPGYTSAMHYVELGCAVVFAANLIQYATYLLPASTTPVTLSKEQLKLLGLSDADLDSSFVVSERNGSLSGASESAEWSVSDADLSLSPRAWRSAPPSRSATPPSPPSPHSPHSPPHTPHSPGATVRAFDATQDRFIDDAQSLAAYLKRRAELEEADADSSAMAVGGWSSPASAPYRLASAAATAAPESSAPAGAEAHLQLDGQRLTQWNLNLRRWLHATVLERLVRELAAADAALARAGLAETGALRAGRVPPQRMRAAAAALPQLRPLLPFLEPFPDQTYLVRRITELATGGCLSAYRWDGGGAGWTSAHPTDADLLLHLFATYLDSQTPGGAGGGGAGAAAGEWLEGAGGPGVVRVRARPPQFALRLGGATLAVGGGRNNLLHALLLLLAAAARRDPPALRRLHLGPAGLNMLWIIGR
ncbi:transmembrane protein 209 isoform X2 [Aricia agestis]|uniref:transmembrane protein 209 isoform X1 n=1 Tax=Aricia agestis TaxID=91739 RepID=UPI001C2098DA|nr:transmembrane protein 209 isoform X1 [Aricia agestis]XP_041984707.1 transmembrane protein 209 isoform X2 [Aricia agestis]